jgi:hypothetical protein
MKKMFFLILVITVVATACLNRQYSEGVTIGHKRLSSTVIRFVFEMKGDTLIDSPDLNSNEHWVVSRTAHKAVDVGVSATPMISDDDAFGAIIANGMWINAGDLLDFTQIKSTYNYGSFPWITVIETSPKYQYRYNWDLNPPAFEKKTIFVTDNPWPAVHIIVIWLCIIALIVLYVITYSKKTFAKVWSVTGHPTVVLLLFFCIACFFSGPWYFIFCPLAIVGVYLFLPEIIGRYRDDNRYYNLVFNALFNVTSALMLLFLLIHKDLYVFLAFIVTLFILVTPTPRMRKDLPGFGGSNIIVG